MVRLSDTSTVCLRAGRPQSAYGRESGGLIDRTLRYIVTGEDRGGRSRKLGSPLHKVGNLPRKKDLGWAQSLRHPLSTCAMPGIISYRSSLTIERLTRSTVLVGGAALALRHVYSVDLRPGPECSRLPRFVRSLPPLSSSAIQLCMSTPSEYL